MGECGDCGKEIDLNPGKFCSNCAWVGDKCYMCGGKPLWKDDEGRKGDMCVKCWT